MNGSMMSGPHQMGVLTAFRVVAIGFFFLTAVSTEVSAAESQVTRQGNSVVLTAPAQASHQAIDYAHARAMTMPAVNGLPSTTVVQDLLRAHTSAGMVGHVSGGLGDGTKLFTRLPTAEPLDAEESGVAPQAFGTSDRPYTTNRVNPYRDTITDSFPFRAAGRLFFNISGSTYVCSASLIKPGVVVTAAHCVAEFGQSHFYSDFQFIPAYSNGVAPYGVWNSSRVAVMPSYFDGTDVCSPSAPGVVCRDDVAVITVTPQSSRYPGESTGWFGYGWNGYGFTGSNIALITQLGYPVALDGGKLMQRTDAQGVISAANADNTVIGSLMTGGSSGGPWLVNLGIQPVLNGTSYGSEAQRNTVVGVTSWGYVSTEVKEQGASPFLSSNIVSLVSGACTATPGAC